MRPTNNPVVPPAGHFVGHFARWMKRLTSKPALGLLAASMAFLAGTVPLRAHESPVGCTGSALGINLFTDTRDVHVGDTIRYSVTIFNGLPGSPRVACDATGIQAAVVTPDGKTNDITSLLVRRTLSNQQNDFYTNVVAYVVRVQDIRPDGTVRATASDTGAIHQNETDSQGGGDQGVNTEVVQPCIRLEVACLGGIGESGLITVSGTVTNCGNTPLNGVVILDSDPRGPFRAVFPTNLLAGQGGTFTGTYLPKDPCGPTALALVAQGTDTTTSTPRTVTSSAVASCANTLTPGILVTKVCPVAPVSPGRLLTYTGTVKNTGNITLTNIVVVDDQPAPDTRVFSLASLAPGATAGFSGSYPAPLDCSVADTLTARAASLCGVAVVSSASATCPIVVSPAIEVTQICPAALVAPGGVLTYTGTVRNSGEGTLTNVVVSNDRSGLAPVFTIATLAPGASADFSGSYVTLTNCCLDSSMVTARGQSICAGTTVRATATRTCALLTSPKIAVTKVCAAGVLRAGDLLTYRGTVSNAGTITLTDVEVVNDRPGSAPLLGRLTLAPGETATYFASYVVPPDFCGTDSVTATGLDLCTRTPVTAKVTSTCPVATQSSISIVKNCPAVPTPLGGLHVYAGTVKNTGDVTLLDVFVVDNQPTNGTPVLGPVTLAPGASVDFTGSYVVSLDCCQTTDTLTARGADRCTGASVQATATQVCPLLTRPALTVTQVCPPTPLAMGSLFRFSGSVTNTGDITLTNVQVFGPRTGGTNAVLGPIELAPGESETFSGSYLVPFDACFVTITGTGQSVCTGAIITNIASCPIATAPAVVITQTCPPGPASPGAPVTYRGTVRNAGDITLTNLVVTDDRGGAAPVFSLAALAPGATADFTGSFLAVGGACTARNTLTVRAASLCGEPVLGSVVADCAVVSTPRIAVVEVCPVVPVRPGGLLVYTGTVRNTGDIPLRDIVVVSTRTPARPVVFTLATLAPGASTNFTGGFVVGTDVCAVSAGLVATANDICTGAVVTNVCLSVCPVATTPAIAVTLACPAGSSTPGGRITFTGTVRNTGDVTLDAVVVADTQGVPRTLLTVPSLAPGASAVFTAGFTAPVDSCSVTATVKATGLDHCTAAAVVQSATATCALVSAPQLVVTQTCPATPAVPGGLLTYRGTVRNAGDITITGLVVTNSRSGSLPVFTLASLAPGMVADFTGSFLAPADVCDVASVSTARGSGTCGAPVSASGGSDCALTTTPAIGVTKVCPTGSILPGGRLIFTGTVSNLGNIMLTNVFVVDDQPGPNTPVLGPITLAPGTGTNFSGSYIVGSATNLATNSVTVVTTNTLSVVSTNTLLVVSTNLVAVLTTNRVAVVTTNVVPVVSTNVVLVVTTNTLPVVTTNLVTTITTNTLPVVTTNLVSTITTNSSPVVTTNIVRTVTTNSLPVVTTNLVSTITTNLVAVVSTNVASVIVTNVTVTLATNVVAPTFTTIDPVSHAVTDRFAVPAGLDGLNYADQDKGYAATQFYTMRRDGSGNSFFDTITASTGVVADRFAATGRDFNSLAFAAPDLGFGSVIFYYLGDDASGTTTFGTITPGGAVGVVADKFVVGQRFDSLTFSATDVGYGANLFYYIRHDAAGISTFGTINPALPGTVTDRFTVGNDIVGLVFTSTDVGYGANRFYYVRQGASGASTFGTIQVTGLTTGVATDRFSAGSAVNELTFTATDTGFGPNLFYALRSGTTRSTNSVTSFVTNKVEVLTTNNVAVLSTNVVAVLATNQLVVRVTNDVPVFTTNIVTVRATNTIEVLATNQLSVRLTNSVPVFATNIVTVRATNFVENYATNILTVRATNVVENHATNLLTVRATNVVENYVTNILTIRATNAVPVFVTNLVTLRVTNDVSTFITNLVAVRSTNEVLVSVTNTVPVFTTNSILVRTTNDIPVFATNRITTVVTNIVAGPMTDTVTASGIDICQARQVAASASCTAGQASGVAPAVDPPAPVIGGAGVPPPVYSGGNFGFSFTSEAGASYTVEYKTALDDPAWKPLPGLPVIGTGGVLTIAAPATVGPDWFYRVVVTR